MINPEVPEDNRRILDFHDIFGNFIFFLFISVTNRKVKQNKSPNLRVVSQQLSSAEFRDN